jgi:hypothetical protein
MKKYIYLLTVALAMALQYCTNDEGAHEKTAITFTASNAGLGTIAQPGIDNVTTAIVSIKNAGGEDVISRQSVKINKTENGYVTEGLALPAGQYNVTEFFLLGDDNKVLYASPLKSSALGKQVLHPIEENVNLKSARLRVDVDVLPVENLAPAAFGYKSFNITAVKFIQIAVTTSDESGFTKALAYVIRQHDTLAFSKLSATANLIRFSAEDTTTCQLVIIKDGYARSTTNFTLAGFGSALHTISLTPAFTFWISTHDLTEYSAYFTIVGDPSSGGINFDWGDGSSSDALLEEADSLEYVSFVNHDFQEGRNYFVSATGEGVNHMSFWGLTCGIGSDCSFYRLSNIEHISFFLGAQRGLVDLRFNSTLQTLVAGGDSLLLPKTSQLNTFYMSGNFKLAASSLDYFVDNIYKNTVAHNIRSGTFNFTTDYYGTDVSGYVGNPTQASWDKLKALRDVYNWSIIPSDAIQ